MSSRVRVHPDRAWLADTQQAKRVVIKVGTSVVSHVDGTPALVGRACAGRLGHLVEQIAALMHSGREVILVSSGAVGVGRRRLRRQLQLLAALEGSELSKDVDIAQFIEESPRPCAAAGQSGLMGLYETLFGHYNITCAQVLLTVEDFSTDTRKRALCASLESMLQLHFVPIVNENDVLASSEVREKVGNIFWDNDSLASLVASELKADVLLLLSDVNGVLRQPPDADSDRATAVEEPMPRYEADSEFSIGAKSRVGRGGMGAKIDAARGAVEAGVRGVIIANGYAHLTIVKVLQGRLNGTLFTKDRPIEDDSQSLSILAKEAREAMVALQALTSEQRRKILHTVADSLIAHENEILAVNQEDIEDAVESGSAPVGTPLHARLVLTSRKLATVADGIRQIADSDEPIGRVLERMELANDLVLEKATSPIGVLLIIFESRPDVLPQISALALKSGNAVILKGGKEARRTNALLHRIVVDTALAACSFAVSKSVINLVNTHMEIKQLLKLDSLIDLVIPRGSNELVNYIKQHTKIPVLGHSDGICHIYVDEEADANKALRVCVDAKVDYPAACNAVETILVHESLSVSIVPQLLAALAQKGVKVYGGPRAAEKFSLEPGKFGTEYGDLELTMELVDDVEQAITHVNKHGSHHTDTIITENKEKAEQFMSHVQSACVFHNASTRFADGYRFGLGAEVGISTSRIHARGPVGVEGLLSTKWILRSSNDSGHVVEDFSNGTLQFTHKKLKA